MGRCSLAWKGDTTPFSCWHNVAQTLGNKEILENKNKEIMKQNPQFTHTRTGEFIGGDTSYFCQDWCSWRKFSRDSTGAFVSKDSMGCGRIWKNPEGQSEGKKRERERVHHRETMNLGCRKERIPSLLEAGDWVGIPFRYKVYNFIYISKTLQTLTVNLGLPKKKMYSVGPWSS